jgi:hypothetical protein
VHGGTVDNGFNLGLDRRTGPQGTYYQVVFQVRRPVAERPPSRPADGPLGDPHDLDHAPMTHHPVGPTTPLGGPRNDEVRSDGSTTDEHSSTGSSSSSTSNSSRCVSNGSETRCESGGTRTSDSGGQTSDGGSSTGGQTETGTPPPSDSTSSQQVDTTVGPPTITYG